MHYLQTTLYWFSRSVLLGIMMPFVSDRKNRRNYKNMSEICEKVIYLIKSLNNGWLHNKNIAIKFTLSCLHLHSDIFLVCNISWSSLLSCLWEVWFYVVLWKWNDQKSFFFIFSCYYHVNEFMHTSFIWVCKLNTFLR